MSTFLLQFVLLSFCFVTLEFVNVATQYVVNVSINANNVIGSNRLHTTLQTVVVPPMIRSSLIHDEIFESLSNLHSNFSRLLFVSFYPNMGIGQIEPPSNNIMCKYLNGESNNNNWNLSLQCPQQSIIDNISFASFGNPSTNNKCGNFSFGTCHCNDTLSIVNKLCLHKNWCQIAVNNETFPIDSTENIINCKNITFKSFGIEFSCNLKNYKYSNWNLTAMNEIMTDYFNAVKSNTIVMDFGVYPNWKYENVSYGNGLNDNPYVISNNYRDIGTKLIDETAQSLADYYGKIVSYFRNGSFIDQYGQKYSNPNNMTFPIEIIEILNDPDIEHSMTPEIYTKIYDAIIANIWKYSDPNHNIKFMGLSLQNYQNYNWFTYFLNHSNHISNDIPIDFISFNFFASCDQQNNCSSTSPNTYNSFFIQSDQFIQSVIDDIIPFRDQLSPKTLIDIDEIGVFLSINNNIPDIFWNAASAIYSYIYSKLCVTQKIDVIGQSFLIGFDTLTHEQFPASPNGIPGFAASITMLNWTNGEPNAKYWSLKMLIQHLNINDALIETTVSNQEIFHAQGFVHVSNKETTQLKLLLINKINENVIINIQNNEAFKGNGILYFVDESTGHNAAKNQSFQPNEPISISPFAVAIAVIPSTLNPSYPSPSYASPSYLATPSPTYNLSKTSSFIVNINIIIGAVAVVLLFCFVVVGIKFCKCRSQNKIMQHQRLNEVGYKAEGGNDNPDIELKPDHTAKNQADEDHVGGGAKIMDH